MLNIEKDVNIQILWPRDEQIKENILNNNSIVAKLNYRYFSSIFTGDIEEITEKQILQQYENNLGVLNATVLKVAHHGSKSSSIQEFIEKVSPKMALIGVGANNRYGHPNADVLERLKQGRCKDF